MMWRLEYIYLSVPAIEGWDAQPSSRLTEFSFAERFQQNAHKSLTVKPKLEILADVSQMVFRNPDKSASDRGEDFASAINIEIA